MSESQAGPRFDTFTQGTQKRFDQVDYDITATEPWLPKWNAQVQSQMSEFLILNGGSGQAPEPMTRDLAEKIARSCVTR